MDRETLEIVRAFVAESLDSLDEQEGRIQDIADGSNRESIHSIFRVFHTIKGLSGFLNFNTINTVTHESETMLDILRNMTGIPNEDIIGIIYEAFDVIRTLLNTVSDSLKDTGQEVSVKNLIGRLQQAITLLKSGGGRLESASKPPASHAPSQEVFVPSEEPMFAPSFSSSANPEAHTHAATQFQSQSIFSDTDFFFNDDQLALLSSEETPPPPPVAAPVASESDFPDRAGLAAATGEMLARYVAEALDLIARVEDGCLILEQDPHNMGIVADVFGAVHSIKGNSGFMGFAEIEDMSMDLENILDAVRSKAIEVYPGLISMILTNIDIIKTAVQALMTNAPSVSSQQQDAPKEAAKAKNVQTATLSASPAQVSSAQPASVHIQDIPAHSIQAAAALHNDIPKFASSDVLPEAVSANIEQAPSPVAMQSSATQAAAPQAASGLAQRKDIRVDTEKLDKLFDLVGELITIETMVTSNPEVVALELQSFTRAAGMLNKITRELQEVTMSIRMTPVEGLFNKMKRLVRDVSMRFDKKISLVISGAETEMDKNVIEEISDPLMHILRNAIDHGVESRERRIAAGKSETGVVKLQARYEGNEILIIIEDDGGGLNRQKILDKAVSKGIIKTAPDKVTDREVFQIIFEPGFSTADKISDISGRGVGMDVVKRNIEKLQGSITVDSKEGLGTRFTLRIPLTLAIMEGMLIRVGQAVYALPILSIRESFRPQPEAITITMDGQEVVRVREDLFSVIRLHEVYDIVPQTTNLQKGILVVVEARERRACLFVDEIIGQQQIVVKGLSDYVGSVKGVTGCMILSNGEIGLITDVDAVLSLNEGALEVLEMLEQ
ncbi:MAG: chemotaxis protein CheA [Candidatus Kapaibacterium sp.]|nr:MAG: chemotaxis protein CheA [Candidatus Kapabacteria bacterium]